MLHFALDRHFRSVDFVSSKHADGVEGLEVNWIIANQHFRKAEVDGLGTVVRRAYTNNRGVIGRLRKKVLIRSDHVIEAHIIAIWILSGTYDVTLDIYGALTIREYGRDRNVISILHDKRLNCLH